MNIALIKQYHENMSKKASQQFVFTSLRRLGIEHVAFKRIASLTEEETFCVMLLRASMIQNALIVIDRPFIIIPHLKDIHFIFQMLEKIADLYYNCYVYDYRWMADKYGDLCQ